MSDPKRAEPNEHAITEALRVLRLAQDICRDYGVEDHIYTIDAAAAEIERLAARVRELERDAERYRFLRGNHWSGGEGAMVVTLTDFLAVGADTFSRENLDEAVDEAMESKPYQETKGER